jgi:choline dehydrogenase-like flavoprotein
VIIDARQIESDAVLRADVCVIGAGAAGITVARRLRGTATSILLLESGGFEQDEPTQSLYEGAVTGEPMRFFGTSPTLDFMRLRWFGGTTNHWGGWCRPLDAADFERRAHVPGSGWPFGRHHLDRWYAEAQAVCELGPYRYDAEWWTERGAGPAALDTPQLRSVVFQLSPPTRFGQVYRAELVSAEDVTVCLWANVVDLALDSNRVAAADVAVLDGSRFRVEASTFVLATGGIEVARLLLACNRDRPAGLGNEHDLVGRHFADHPHLGFPIVLADRDLDLYELASRTVRGEGTTVDEVSTVGALTPTPEASDALALQGLGAIIDVVATDGGAAEIAPAEVGALLGVFEGVAATPASLTIRAEQQPNPDSRVRMVRERDRLGVPKVEVDWRLAGADRDSLARGLDLLADELAAGGIAHVRSEVDGETALERAVDVGCHHMGTARMHDDPRHGVVDANCRVHGLTNLYVAGSAVFPTTGWVNPTLTIVALALRLGDHLIATGR